MCTFKYAIPNMKDSRTIKTQNDFRKLGIKKKLEYQQTKKPKTRRRKKSVEWYNPPFSKAASNNFGSTFSQRINLR